MCHGAVIKKKNVLRCYNIVNIFFAAFDSVCSAYLDRLRAGGGGGIYIRARSNTKKCTN